MPPSPAAWAARRRFVASAFAAFSFFATVKRSPASGTSLRPSTSTGVDGPAVLMRLPSESVIALIRP